MSSELILMRFCQNRLEPILNPRLSAPKVSHIYKVNAAFAALVQGNYNYLFETLPPEKQTTTDYHAYCTMLSKVKELYMSLPPCEKRNLAAAVALHDLGFIYDQGLNHGLTGAKHVSEAFMQMGVSNVDRMAVSELVQFHGIYSDCLVQLLPSDLQAFSRARKIQSLIITLADHAGKPASSRLFQEALEINLDIFNGKYDDPKEYYRLRLRTLLGPPSYSYLDEKQFKQLTTIIEQWPQDEQQALFHNMNYRFRNLCWPVFQELVLIHAGLSAFSIILRRISSLATTEYPNEKNVYIGSNPDFFFVDYKDRPPYFAIIMASPETVPLTPSKIEEDGIITIDLG